MYDVHVIFSDMPGELARWATVRPSRRGAGGRRIWYRCPFSGGGRGKSRRVLMEAGFTVQAVRKPVIRKLRQERPGELGDIAAVLAARGVSILTQYSDHANHLILLTDDDKLAAEITEPWAPHVKNEPAS
jgi:hypothetical protein